MVAYRQALPVKATVRRQSDRLGGSQLVHMDPASLVYGDVVEIRENDVIPADLRVIECSSDCIVDQSVFLTYASASKVCTNSESDDQEEYVNILKDHGAERDLEQQAHGHLKQVLVETMSDDPLKSCNILLMGTRISEEKSAMMESTLEESYECDTAQASELEPRFLPPNASTLIRINELEEKPSQSPTLPLQYFPSEQRTRSKARSRRNKSSPISFRSCSMLPEYFFRIVYYRQMDLDATFYQMITLLLQPSKVYKSAYYRKQTKNRWARDDPAFAVIELGFLLIATIAWAITFQTDNIGSFLSFLFHAIIVEWLGMGLLIATTCWYITNNHLRLRRSQIADMLYVEQHVEWQYAFDIHCNSFFVLFLLLYVIQFLLLPLLVSNSFTFLFVGNCLYSIAWALYTYITFLGYMALPFLHRTERLLLPLVFIGSNFLILLFLRLAFAKRPDKHETPPQPPSEAWKAFGNDTEAGRLLRKLYCGNQKPKISYPKLHIMKTAPSSVFIPAGGTLSDSRTHVLPCKTSQRAVKVPTGKQSIESPEHPLDRIGNRRKPYHEIEKEILQIKRQLENFRYPTAASTHDKEKLQHVFAYSKGSILPDEMLPGADLIDRDLRHQYDSLHATGKSRLMELEKLYDAVVVDIESKRHFVTEMMKFGNVSRAAAVEQELEISLSELKHLHQLIRKEKGLKN
ncbi:hypothetical protein ABG067_006431 [Albugo candida]